ncbi:protein scarlet-like isoform X2 [Venturia canescens]|nr:protein scarlet-like isoform X2 [Venturia canescens]
MAILGPSGCGKTTLLATISRRLKGDATGDVLLNGEPVDRKIMSRISGFVPQEDLAVESLTVQEHMEFMARMKMDRRFKSAFRTLRIAVLLGDLGLDRCQYTKLSGLSGGERRRVSLAVQLLTEPSVLFCDEPTTGLDSYSAMVVIRTLREVAARGRVVICSIHQPASGLLDLFHEILLISAGRVAFQGSSANATKFFNSLALCCPPTFNSAEFFVSQLSVTRDREAECLAKTRFICDQFQKSIHGQLIKKKLEDSCAGILNEAAPHPIFSSGASSMSINEFKKVRSYTQLEWLTWRNYIDYKRNKFTIFFKFLLYMFIGLLVAVPYVSVTENIDQRGIQNMQGLMYLVVTETIFTFNYGVFYTFPKELPLLLRDIAGGLYSPAPYYVSKVVVMIPGAIVQPFLYTALIFGIVGLKGGFAGFLFFAVPVMLSAAVATAVGCLMSAAFESIDTASLLAVPIDFLTLIFSGIYLHLRDLPVRVSWLKYISHFYYSTEAVSLVQWSEFDHIACPEDPEEPCVSSGAGVLDKYGYEPGNYITDLVGLVAMFAAAHVAGYLALRIRSRKQPVY